MAVQSGAISREEFAEQFRAHSRLFWCIAAGVLGDRGRAVDVVQEAAVVGLSRLGQFHAGTSFQAWMGQIVRFVALNESRKHRAGSVSDDVLAELQSTKSGDAAVDGTGAAVAARVGVDRFSGQLAGGQEAFDDDVSRALAELDGTARACLLMRTVLNMTYAEIGATLEIPEGTAMSHVHRSRAAMRKRLGAKFGGSQTGRGAR